MVGTGLTSWAQMHIPASVLTALMTSASQFTLGPVTSSYKMGVIALSLQGFSKAHCSLYYPVLC